MTFFGSAVRPVLFRLGGGDPERAHEFTLRRLAALGPGQRAALRRAYAVRRPVEVFGVTFPNRVGLAAGMDKDGAALPACSTAWWCRGPSSERWTDRSLPSRSP